MFCIDDGHEDQRKLDDAIFGYRKVIQLKPVSPEIYNNLGNAYKFKGEFEKAEYYYRKALTTNPNYARAYYNLGILFKEEGRLDETLFCYQKAVVLKPDFIEAYYNLGNTLRELGKLDQAVGCYQTALKINPDYAPAYNGWGTVLQEQGKPKEASRCYCRYMQISPDAGIKAKSALLLPVVCESTQSIVNCRKAMSVDIDKLSHQNLQLHDPSKQVGNPNFFLAYHGLNNKRLQKKIALFYLQTCPDLGWKPPTPFVRNGIDKRIKLGAISQNFHRHTIGYLNSGIIETLDRQKFHVTVFRFPGRKDSLSKTIERAADNAVLLPLDLYRARQIIYRQALDILFYPDIGMDPLTYFLAFSRLAPVQCTTWGHPDTTGIPNIDYYISSEKAEPDGAQAHYTERLILFNQFPMYCYRPDVPKEMITPKDLKLPENRRFYACTQSLFKVHPDFDKIMAEILRQDPQGIILFFDGKHTHWTKLLRERFDRTMPDVCRRVLFLKRLPEKDFLSFLRIPDVILDTPHFSGGYTSLLAFACAAPIVTWPAKFMRGRLTYALYKQMGVMECVAHDFNAYINIALKLSHDKVWKEEIQKKINAQAHLLFEDTAPVHELESFFQWAVSHHRIG